MHCNLRPLFVASVVLGFNYEAIMHQPTHSTIPNLCRPIIHPHTKFQRNQTIRGGDIVIMTNLGVNHRLDFEGCGRFADRHFADKLFDPETFRRHGSDVLPTHFGRFADKFVNCLTV